VDGKVGVLRLAEDERANLGALVRSRNAPHKLVERAKILLVYEKLGVVKQVAAEVGVAFNTATCWIRRWPQSRGVTVEQRLADTPRSGAPAKFSPETICQIVAVSCEKPEECGRPITHWSARELADEVVQRAVVAAISVRCVGRILKQGDIQPHKFDYWLTDKDDPGPQKDEKIHSICEVYRKAQERHEQGERTFSVDEKTGIQALERAGAELAMKPGHPQKLESEYCRHGTQALIGTINVATGHVHGLVRPTRTEQDFADALEEVIASDPERKRWHIVADNLNTHFSETVVRLVARHSAVSEELLGRKGECGVLKSMESRRQFITDPSHKIVFYFTHKHGSWMNQIELWFAILVKKLLRRGNFTSVEDLKKKILDFIDYFNRTMARPFRWTYTGKVLTA
jgi:transposase